MSQSPRVAPQDELAQRVSALERELAARDRTVEVLMDMVERGSTATLGQGFAALAPAPTQHADPQTRRLRQALAEVRARHKSLEDHTAKLEEAATFQRSIVDAVDANICILDLHGIIVTTNAQWQAFARDNGGLEAATGPGTSYLDVCFRAEGPGRAEALEIARHISRVLGGDPTPFTLEYACHGLQQRWFQARVSPMLGSSLGRAVVAHFDITNRRSTEARLAQAERLESIGQLAAGIAHEINTPMQYIGDNLLFLEKAFGRLEEAVATCEALPDATHLRDGASRIAFVRERVPRAIAQARDGVDAVARIVGAMRVFARPSADDDALTPADLNSALENTVVITRNSWKYVADVVTDLAPDLPRVMADVGALGQVFVNLLVNAAHAIEDAVTGDARGTITVRSRYDAEADEVVVSFEDTGTGIRPEVIDRIFDPFFTTKAVGRGTGQGLAIARSIIVKRHGGRIELRSKLGEGTVFTVRLPVGAVSAERAQ